MNQSSTFARRVATASFIFLLLLALFLLIGYAASFFFLVFGGIVFAVVFSALAHFVEQKTPLSYGVSVVVVLLVLVVIVGGGIWALAPTVSAQADQLAQSVPQAVSDLKSRLGQSSWGRQLLNSVPQQPGKLLSGGGPGKGVLSQLTGIVSGTLGALVNGLIVLITGIYLASGPGSYRQGFVRLFNPGYRQRLLGVMDQCYDTLKNWFISRSITMVVVAVATSIGLTVLGIPFAIVLGLIAGLLNFIPNLGPYLAMAPALLVAFPQGLMQPVYVAALYMGIQSLEGYILTPMLDKKFVSVPPALLLFGQVLLGVLVGLVGILFASPLIAVLLVIVEELYVKDRLEAAG